MQESVNSLIAEKLDDYFDEMRRCGGVPPAPRYRLEGFLQALLATGQVSESQLRDAVAARIKSFNAAGAVALEATAQAWQLPYAAPLAPVKPSTS